MSTGLIALLDDIVGLAKVAAASLDDVAAQAAKAGTKAAGVVIDDAAVTPRYVVGFAANRELPIIRRIAMGSLKNKLIFLLPAALALSVIAPWAITPLLMLGGAFLCYEGAEKVLEALKPHPAVQAPEPALALSSSGSSLEDAKVKGAIQTDFILSAEIMAITLAGIPESGFWQQAAILAVVGVGITLVVYGGVALIVKADDAGVALAAADRPVSVALGRSGAPLVTDRLLRPVTQALGRGLVLGMPPFLILLGIVGTVAMLWVGGGIIVHGLEGYGIAEPGHTLHVLAERAAAWVGVWGAAVNWFVSALGAALVGLVLGGLLVPVVHQAQRLRGHAVVH